ncbi:hypothetical protein YQE_01588, partial [Dendroctonus ponderosae]
MGVVNIPVDVSLATKESTASKVRLICSDGTRYTRDIDVVRKCALPSKAFEAEHTQNIYGFAPEVTNEADLYPLSNQPALSPSYLTQTAPNDAEPRTAPVVQKSDAQAVEGVKLTFLVPNETESGEHLNGLVVQHIDESEFEHAKKERFVLYHDKQCLLSAFLYFTTITSFVYLALIWIKQRMHVHLDQFQLW